MENLPLYIPLVFILTSFTTVVLFYRAIPKPRATLTLLTGWLLLQAVVALSGFYTVSTTVPPRFALLVFPPLLTIALVFGTGKGRRFLDSLDIRRLTMLHIIRIPVEVTLFWLFLHKAVPGLMTFEGRNFDIISGITAPVVYYYGFRKEKVNRLLLIGWNIICLALLINIVAIAVLSAPFTFQSLAFEQPNVAILYFPFIWLPCCIVPLVLLAHLAVLRRLGTPAPNPGSA